MMSRRWVCTAAVAIAVSLLIAASQEAAADGPVRKVLWGFPTRKAHEQAEHKDEGRITGSLKQCPGCTIELLTPDKGVVHAMELKLGDPDYTTPWLSPGDYTLRVAADGWPLLIVPKVRVEDGSDTTLDFGFLEKKPTPRGSEDSGIPTDIERMPDWKAPSEPKVPVRDFKPGLPKDLNPKNRNKNNDRNRKGKGKKNKKRNRKKNKRNKGMKILGGK